jgi:hypothetical protein
VFQNMVMKIFLHGHPLLYAFHRGDLIYPLSV